MNDDIPVSESFMVHLHNRNMELEAENATLRQFKADVPWVALRGLLRWVHKNAYDDGADECAEEIQRWYDANHPKEAQHE